MNPPPVLNDEARQVILAVWDLCETARRIQGNAVNLVRGGGDHLEGFNSPHYTAVRDLDLAFRRSEKNQIDFKDNETDYPDDESFLKMLEELSALMERHSNPKNSDFFSKKPLSLSDDDKVHVVELASHAIGLVNALTEKWQDKSLAIAEKMHAVVKDFQHPNHEKICSILEKSMKHLSHAASELQGHLSAMCEDDRKSHKRMGAR
jgi:hypothetical protein